MNYQLSTFLFQPTINYELSTFLLLLQHGNKETAKNIKAPHERVERDLSKRD